MSFEHVLAGNVLSPGPARNVVFLLFLAGFGVKAGMIPLHVWLPEAHPAAPTSISALMSGVVIKTGIYGLFRVCAFGLGEPPLAWGVLVLACGGASAILGVLYALMQHDLKRLLAYHSIENIGIILLGLGAGMMALSAGRPELAAVGIAASLFHVLNHALFKGLLFLGAGGVVVATGTRHIEEMGGLAKRMPWTALFFLVGAAAISGLPLLNGFVSEWLLFQAFLFGFLLSSEALVRFLFPVAGALLALTSALAAACFVKAFGMTFLALPRGEGAEKAHESPGLMLVPQGFLALHVRRARAGPGVGARGAAGSRGLAAGSASGAGDGARVVRDRAGAGALRPPDAAARGDGGARGAGAGVGDVAGGGLRGEARADVGVRGRADGADGVHGDGVLEAPDDDLQRDVPADAGGGDGGGSALSARGEVPVGDRADVRAVLVRAADAGRDGRGRADEGDPGR